MRAAETPFILHTGIYTVSLFLQPSKIKVNVEKYAMFWCIVAEKS